MSGEMAKSVTMTVFGFATDALAVRLTPSVWQPASARAAADRQIANARMKGRLGTVAFGSGLLPQGRDVKGVGDACPHLKLIARSAQRDQWRICRIPAEPLVFDVGVSRPLRREGVARLSAGAPGMHAAMR